MATNFWVQFELTSPIILTNLFTLDSLLAGVIYDQTEDLNKAHNEIPLEFSGGVYHGSVGFLSKENDTLPDTKMISWAKSLSLVRGDISTQFIMPQKKGERKYELSRGPFKIILSKYTCTMADTITFFGRGDLDRVQALLGKNRGKPLIPGLGKKRNQGYGTVHCVEYEEIPEDLSLVNEKGVPMRPIPCNGQSMSAPVDYCGYMPPNYEHKTICYIPTSIVWGRNEPEPDAFGADHAVKPSDPPEDPLSMLHELGWLLHRKFAPQDNPPKSPKHKVCGTCGTTSQDLQFYSTSKHPLCERCYAWGRKYPITRNDGKQSSGPLGIGVSFFVGPEDKIVYGPIAENPYFTVKPKLSGVERSRFLAEMALNPPRPPWIFMEGGKDTQGAIQNLEINYGSDFLKISGANKRSIKAYEVRRAIRVIQETGVSLKELKKYIADKRKLERVNEENLPETEKKLQKRVEKNPEVVDAHAALPSFGSEEYSIVFGYFGEKAYA